MNQLKQFGKRFEENHDLVARGMATYPVHRDLAALKRRHDAADPNVMAYLDENGYAKRFEVNFTKKQSKELREAYRSAKDHLPRPNEDEEEVFVRTIEAFADAILDFQVIEPPDQKVRQRAIDSLIAGVEKMDSALAEMDSGSLGWLYANIVDRLSIDDGVQISPGDSEVASMRRHPMRAQVEAGELRSSLRKLASTVITAARESQSSLPKFDRIDNNVRLKTSKALEELIVRHGMKFVVTETGFPAHCLRSMFDLAGLECEKVGYWLKKAADDADSYARFVDRLRHKNDGENPPPL